MALFTVQTKHLTILNILTTLAFLHHHPSRQVVNSLVVDELRPTVAVLHCRFFRVRKPLYLSSHGILDSIRCLHDISSNQNAYCLVSNEIFQPYP